MNLKSASLVFSTLVCLIVSGCAGSDDGRPDVVPVSGTVLYNGDPVSGATVSFWAEGAPRAATGVTNAEGKFRLTMFEVNDGAMVGENAITVEKVEGGAAAAADPTALLNDPSALSSMSQQGGDGNGPAGPTSLIPAVYGSQTSTTLKETVSAEGENSFVLQLAD